MRTCLLVIILVLEIALACFFAALGDMLGVGLYVFNAIVSAWLLGRGVR